MKLLYCLFFMSVLLYEGKARTTTTKTTTTASPKNLTGKMLTVSPSAMVIFNPKNNSAPGEIPGVSVCLRYMWDLLSSSDISLFQLLYHSIVSVSLNGDGMYALYFNKSQVPLNPFIPLWSTVQEFPWISVCLVLNFQKNVAQVFQGNQMSIRKIPLFKMAWSGVPRLGMFGFDGQATDLQVWDFPMQYSEVFSYMKNSGIKGSVLTWSNIEYEYYGDVLLEDSFPLRQVMKSNEGDEQPIRSKQGRDRRLQHRRMFNGMGKMF